MMEPPDESPRTPENIAFMAVAFEGGLAIVALVLGLLFRQPPLDSVPLSIDALGANCAAILIGLAAALPMMAGLLLLDRFPLRWFAHLEEVVQKQIVPLFRTASWTELAIISAAAGIGEEMLFRGFFQSLIARWSGAAYGEWIGLAAASVAFGACHWITNTYAVLAVLVGLYFGWLFLATDNLLAPITAHAAYDLFALAYMVKFKSEPSEPEQEVE